MKDPLTSINTATAAVGEAWLRALPFGVVESQGVSVVLRQMDDGGLRALLDRVTDLGRRADALTAALAGEIAARSPRGMGTEGLAQRSGFGSPARAVAASTGGTVGRAAVLTTVGTATADRLALTGEVLAPAHPHVAVVVRAGRVSVEAAHLIITMLDGISSRVAPDQLEAAEAMLAEKATQFTLEQLRKLVERMEARLDPDGVEPREEVLRAGRTLTMVQDRGGRFRLRGTFDPETGAPIKAALDAFVSNALRASRGHNHPDGGACGAPGGDDGGSGVVGDGGGPVGGGVMVETRTTGQLAADAFADFARHVLACTDRVPGLPAVNVVVRMDLEDLQCRAGGSRFATIDGVDQPLSAATARRMACSAGLLPAVFDGAALPLDLGRSARLFTRGQVIALWGRDGGCASCGQTTFVEAHHAEADWAKGGRTDLSKGVLLCSRCHHRVHRDGWDIRIQVDGVWFVPPPDIDPDRKPRPGVQRQGLREHTRHHASRPSRLGWAHA